MVNTIKLLEKIQQSDIKTSELIAALNISHQTFYNRISARDFKLSEAEIITKYLGLTDAEQKEIFLPIE